MLFRTLILSRYKGKNLPNPSKESRIPNFLERRIIRVIRDNLVYQDRDYDRETDPVKKKEKILYESEMTKLPSVLLPYYFSFQSDWVISPEQNHGEAHHPDYTVYTVDDDTRSYLLLEVKRGTKYDGDSWHKVLKDQMWNQADMAKQENGRLWMVGQNGFEICFFKFDVERYNEGSPDYANFKPLNLRNWSIEDFKSLEIELITELVNNVEEIKVIKWRLDNDDHCSFIHEMFVFILNHGRL